ncbi:uncharacterized protein LOC114062542 isoform X2 [Empidonax traillii]|uniref:uncharacterized protein LOC114062542 isoform X2 n=1 Tax=Empidonax traillii TaxID=164674 RepID=UPI000FFCF838|nr:uncharacterized protein LOC114062542 isoform X2 [Empidonax traillii]
MGGQRSRRSSPAAPRARGGARHGRCFQTPPPSRAGQPWKSLENPGESRVAVTTCLPCAAEDGKQDRGVARAGGPRGAGRRRGLRRRPGLKNTRKPVRERCMLKMDIWKQGPFAESSRRHGYPVRNIIVPSPFRAEKRLHHKGLLKRVQFSKSALIPLIHCQNKSKELHHLLFLGKKKSC